MKKKSVKTPAKKSKAIKSKVSAIKKTSAAKKISKKPLAKNTKVTKKASSNKSSRKLVSIRILTSDIEAMRKKAAKIGIPYQTYINILIHRDAIGG